MLTGRFPSAHHVDENRGCEYAVYGADLMDVARSLGYSTAMIGKNHSHLRPERVDHWFELGHAAGSTMKLDAVYIQRDARQPWASPEHDPADRRAPQERAFDRWLAILNHATSTEATPFPVACQGPYRAVSDACEWIHSRQGDPFCLWLTFAEPHNPYQVPEPYFSMFPAESLPPVVAGPEALAGKGFAWQWTSRLGHHAYGDYDQVIPRARANYFGMLRLIDDQVRRFVGFLQAEGQWENTLLVFVSDHGDFVGEYGLVRKGPEMPEVLARIPCFVVGPGVHADAHPHPAFVSLVDILPTVCECLGTPIPAGVQGRSLWPLLSGAPYPRRSSPLSMPSRALAGCTMAMLISPTWSTAWRRD